MMTRKAAAEARKQLWRDIQKQHRQEARAKVGHLREQVRAARAARKDAIRQASERCRTERLAARERAKALRERALAELREAVRLERLTARETCSLRRNGATSKDGVARARAELAAERAYRADLRRIERNNKARTRAHPHVTYVERRTESDDEVRGNLPPDLVPLFERVKRGIKGSTRMSRTEAFLKYAEEHPDEVLELAEDKTDAIIRELERKEREAARALAKGPKRRKYTPEELAAVPF